MLILALGSMCGVGIGLARGGRLSHLSRVRFRGALLPVLALVVQMTAGALSADWRFPAVVASYGLIAAWLVVNARHRQGAIRFAIALVAVGWLLNMAPMLLNKGMPVSRHALRAIGAPTSISVTQGHLFKHVPADRDTALSHLGDVIPVRRLRAVISAGDVVLAVGLGAILVSGMGRRRVSPAP